MVINNTDLFLDIEWIWHNHMLNPSSYSKDLEGDIIPHYHYPKEEKELVISKTRELWTEIYPEEPFDVDESKIKEEDYNGSKFSYDILGAINRQKVFYYQVN